MSLITVIPAISGNKNLPIVDPADIEWFTDLDSQAYDRWMFQGSASQQKTGVVNGKMLTEMGTVTFNSDHVTIPIDLTNALKSDFYDAAPSNLTLCAVVRIPNTVALMGLMGNREYNRTLDDSGFSVYTRGPGVVYSAIEYDILAGPVETSVDGSHISAGNWVFLGYSLSHDASNVTTVHLKSEPDTIATKTITAGTYNIGTNPISLSVPGGSDSMNGTPADFAEFAIYPFAMNPGELLRAYLYSKGRMSAAGISVV